MQGSTASCTRSALFVGALTLAAGTVFSESATDVDSVTGASVGYSHEGVMQGHQHGDSPDGMMTKFGAELGLTAQQQTDIQIIMSDYGERFGDLAKLGRASAEELLSMAPDDPAYRVKTEEASALAATSAAEMVVLLAEMRGKLYAVLTEAQRETLRRKIAEKKQQLEEKKQQQQDGDESHDRPLEQFIR